MNRFQVSLRSLLILSLVLLPGILGLNAVYGITKQPTTITTSIVTPMPISAGTGVTDSASLFGANVASDTGASVTYNLFSGSKCKGKAIQSQTVTITAAPNPPNSAPFVISTVGSYSLKASFNGNALNGASSSKCEIPVTVIKASPTVSTMLSLTSITTAQSVTDSATLTGATATAHGTMTYYVFAGSACSGTQVSVSTTSVINGAAQPSKPFSDSPGSYSFQAVYSGDQNNNAAATGSCPSSEKLAIAATSPTISTTLLQSTIVAGQSVTDSATLTGVTATAGGTVTYTLYRETTCTTAIDTSTVTVTNGIVPNSKAFVINDATHTYGILAVYTGDANNNPATTPSCEQPINVNPTSPTISTQLSAAQIFTDGGITDTATLHGATSNAGGTLNYKLYSGNACSGPAVDSDSESVMNDVVPTSKAFLNHGVGTFSFQVFYSGDAGNNVAQSLCNEIFTVVKHSPSLSTQLSATMIPPVSGTVTDTATLTSASTNAGGTVTIDMYSGDFCSGAPFGFSPALTVTNGMPVSFTFGPSIGAGVFSFQATYTGDGNNMPATSPCNEFLTVASFPSVITTMLSSSTITVSGVVTDTATLTGVTTTAGGSVKFTMYPGGSCTGTPIDSATETVTNGFVPTTGNFGPGDTSSVGTFSFQAVYTPNNADNLPATSSCELLTVNRASPTLSTLLSATSIVHGGSVTDTATLTGAVALPGTGMVTFTMYMGSSCSGTVVSTWGPIAVNGAGVATSAAFTAATAGTYSFSVFYSGDANNNPATATCELLTAT